MTTFTLFPGRLEDLDEAVPMFNLTSQKLIGTDEFDLTEYRAEWTLPTLDLAADTRVVRAEDGTLIGTIEVWNGTAPYISNWVWGRVHPDYERQGVGTALMEWAETRAREKMPLAEEGTRIHMSCGHISTNEAAKALFEKMGFSQNRYHYTMETVLDDLPPAPILPDGITIRPMNAPDEYEAVHRADQEIFRDHWGFVVRPFEDTFPQMMHFIKERGNHDPSLFFVAMDGDHIAGISLCEPESSEDRSAGYVGSLGVRRDYRQHGLGLALLQHSFRAFYQRGKRKVQLGVDGSNITGALRLYERAGMYVLRQFNTYEKILRPGIILSTQG
jgi:mycothiol synthase